MGIFSRLFQRGQDGNPADAPAGDDRDPTDPEIEITGVAPQGQGTEPPASAPPADDPAPSRGGSLLGPSPGLTPAFATSPATASAGVASEPQRSIWDWPGPAPRRNASGGSGGGGERSGGDRGASHAPPPEPTASEARPPARGGLPSVPRGQSAGASDAKDAAAKESGSKDAGAKEAAAKEAAAKEAKERDPTMVQSPPPAPASPPGRGSRAQTAAPLPGLPPSPAKPASPPASPQSAAPAPAAASPPPPASAAATPPPPPQGKAAAPAARPAAAAAAAAATPAGRPARRPHSDSVTAAFDQVIEAEPGDAARPVAPAHGVSTVEDLAEVRRVFNDVAVVHVSQVRDVMLELRYGDAQPGWVESTQPALRSLRAMAGQMDLVDLCQALDEFCVAVDAAVIGRARIDDDGKAELLRRYQRLIELIPQAFELDAERDRREPIIVEALLLQVVGVEKRTIEKLFAVGLSRLDALMQATAEELAVVAGIRPDLSAAIVDQLRSYRTGASSALAAPDPLAERRQLGDLLIMMSVANDEHNHAATMWTDEARNRKQEARKRREQVFQRIKVALARLGERDLLARLDRMTFGDRIAALDRYLSAAIPMRAPGAPNAPNPSAAPTGPSGKSS